MSRKLVTTADGSHTLFVPELDEHYHSVHGAVQESLHVFIQYGLQAIANAEKPLHIFEMGLGTGLNLLLTALQPLNRPVHYVAVEAYPVTTEEATNLNYGSLFADHPEAKELLQAIHQLPWNKPAELRAGLTLLKLHAKLMDIVTNQPINQSTNQPIDLIYYDAFAPTAQPELWTEEVFKALYSQMANGGILATYCAKGSVKRALKAAGFTIEALPGPPGKREMTRAIKTA